MKKLRFILLAVFTLFFLSALIPLHSVPTSAGNVDGIYQLQGTPQPLGLPTPMGHDLPCDPDAVHGLYFYSTDCPHCMEVLEDLIRPLQQEFGSKLDLRLVEISYASNYELLIRAEEFFGVKAEERAIPTLIIAEEVLIGEEPIRANLRSMIEEGIVAGGIDWPPIPNLDTSTIITAESASAQEEICSIDSADTCEVGAPIHAAYFYQTGCQSCSRIEADLAYLRSKYPQLIVESFNVYENAGLANWLAQRANREEDFLTPAVFIGNQAWLGEDEITPQNIEFALQCLAQEGAPKVWEAYDQEQGISTIAAQFRAMSWLTVVLAGLVDGLNPCAFATLIFFVSYLTLSGRKGREVLLVGASFTLGVFMAYLVIGLGLYELLDRLGQWLTILGRWVYGITAVLCLGLAVFSFLDFLKVRKGDLGDMALKLPENLRKRINAAIRKGRGMRGYTIGAFVTGLVISLLELACTGQVYLPTIIFVSSMPELRLRAIFYLVLYNLLFILPLMVVFILAYFGTTSKDLTKFLQKNAAVVKLGTTLLFLALGIWLGVSIIG